MNVFQLSELLGEDSRTVKTLRWGFQRYKSLVWDGFDLAYRASRKLRHRPSAPPRVRSVLHVSVLSHKPYMLSRMLRRRGLRSEYLALHAETGWLQIGRRGYDFNIPADLLGSVFRPFLEVRNLIRMLSRYDVIHYHFGSLITTDGRELDYLRDAGKVIIFHFRGCDLRQGSVNLRLHPDLNCCQECDYPPGSCETPLQALRIARARKYADRLFVTTPDLLDFLPEGEHIPFIAPTEVNLDAITPVRRDTDVFRVVTSSNHDGVDGTPYVRAAVEKLRARGHAIELVEVHRKPYEEALAIYKSADVYVGKLRMGYYNNANIECMAMAIPCMSYIRPRFQSEIEDCPIIIARPDTVSDVLEEWFGRRDALRAIGARGPAFVRTHHDPDDVTDRLLDRYNSVLRDRRDQPR